MSEDNDVAWGELRAEIRALNLNVARLTEVVDKNTEQLGKVEVLESNHKHQNEALGRAFAEIKESRRAQEITNSAQAEKNMGYDKYVWVVTGFVAAVCMFWTVIGYRINQQIDETLRAVTEMKLHIVEDRIKSPDDVLRLVPKEPQK